MPGRFPRRISMRILEESPRKSLNGSQEDFLEESGTNLGSGFWSNSETIPEIIQEESLKESQEKFLKSWKHRKNLGINSWKNPERNSSRNFSRNPGENYKRNYGRISVKILEGITRGIPEEIVGRIQGGILQIMPEDMFVAIIEATLRATVEGINDEILGLFPEEIPRRNLKSNPGGTFLGIPGKILEGI